MEMKNEYSFSQQLLKAPFSASPSALSSTSQPLEIVQHLLHQMKINSLQYRCTVLRGGEM